MSKEDSSSWRDTLFVWDGILVATPSDKNDSSSQTNTPLKWEGTWVGVDNQDATQIDAPKRGAFEELVASDMQFSVEGSATHNHEGTYYTASLTKGSGWDLKQGDNDEKKQYSDTTHDVYLENLKWTGNLDNPTANLLVATGKNEFGNFVSAGWMRPGNRLTLARRYISDGDVRREWTLEDLRKNIIEQVVVDGKARTPPWQCDVMNCEYTNSKKRSLEQDGDNKAEESGEKKAKESES